MSTHRISTSQAADIFQWVGYTLFFVFLAQVLPGLFPVALLQPQWMVRASAAIRGTATLPLLGMALLILAYMIDKGVSPASNQLRVIRRLCTMAAIGFLLLIPLQSYGTVTSVRRQADESQGQVNKIVQTTNQIQKATNEVELRNAIRQLPGGEQLANRPFGADLQTIKTGLIARLGPTAKRLENQIKDRQNKVLQTLIIPLIRDGLICLAYALGYSSMGFRASGKATPLRSLLKPHNLDLINEMFIKVPSVNKSR